MNISFANECHGIAHLGLRRGDPRLHFASVCCFATLSPPPSLFYFLYFFRKNLRALAYCAKKRSDGRCDSHKN
jgi:hypothetical protein